MPRVRFARTAALAAMIALAGSATAVASERHGTVPAGAVIENPTGKPLSMKKAKQLRAKIKRTKRFPAPPHLRVKRSKLERGDRSTEMHAPGDDVHLPTDERLFGNATSYIGKRDQILGAIQNFNAYNIPRNGGRYNAPKLYEMKHGAPLPGCGAQVYNGVFCPGVNAIGWSMSWMANAFSTSGDMMWATLIAHEYGHASQRHIGLSGGWLNYTLYSEAYADCMAGAFLWWAHYYRMTDNVGRGDYNEFRDAFVALASPTTELGNHGTFQWRYTSATYGWNTGFDGCVKWARSIDGA
jgi:uncharacterized protein